MQRMFSGVFAATLALAPLTATNAFAAPAPVRAPLAAAQLQLLSAQGSIKADQLLVKFKQAPAQIALDRALAGLKLRGLRGFYQPRRLPAVAAEMARWQVISFKPEQNLAEAFSRLVADPAVEYVVPNRLFTTAAMPNDPSFGQLWGLHNTGADNGSADADIDAAEAWDIQSSAANVVVAVIDTGVDYTHPDLAANMWTNPGEIAGNGIDDDANGYIDDIHGYDFVNADGDPMDDNIHGTHVAGTIAAVGNNGIGVAGVAWQAKIMALKFLDASGSGYSADAIDAILYAADMGARLSNNSWGGTTYDRSGMLFDRPLEDAIRTVGESGHLFVVAAGNDGGFRDDTTSALPAGFSLPNILTVAATDRNDQLASFSNYGAVEVDIAAPGVAILSTVPGGGYGLLDGTSMATPHVVGAAALLLAKKPDLTHYELRSLLMSNVDTLAALSGKVASGGRLNLHKALSALNQAPCTSFTGTVGSHITAGRAHACGLYFAYGCANGSNQNLGSRYGSTPVTLVQQSPNHYVQGACAGGLNLAPTVLIDGEAEAYVLKGGNYTAPAATAQDREDGVLSTQIVTTGSVDTGTAGQYVLSYDVADSAGIKAVTAKVLVHVRETDEAPSVELFGSYCLLPLICFPVLVEQNQPFVEDGYFGWDEIDGDLTANVTRSGSVLTDTSTLGRYQVTYDVIDSSGQHNRRKNALNREVFVLTKEAPEIFTDEGPEYSVAVGTCCDYVQTFGMDLKDGFLNAQTVGKVDMDRLGTYVLTHSVTDSDANTVSTTQTVHVVQDVTPPVATLNGPAVMYLGLGEPFYDPYASGTDDLDHWPAIWDTGVVDVNTAGVYQIEYVAVDGSGNQSAPVVRTVVVQAACQQYSATVAGHIGAGRAYVCGTYATNGCATGSGELLGNRYLTTPLIVREQPSGSGMFYKGACQ